MPRTLLADLQNLVTDDQRRATLSNLLRKSLPVKCRKAGFRERSLQTVPKESKNLLDRTGQKSRPGSNYRAKPLRNKLLLKSPDGKKAVSILEAALGLSRTYPDMSIEMLASVKAVPVPVEQPVKPKMDTSGLTLEQLLQLAAEWGVTVPVGSAREDVLALLKAA